MNILIALVVSVTVNGCSSSQKAEPVGQHSTTNSPKVMRVSLSLADEWIQQLESMISNHSAYVTQEQVHTYKSLDLSMNQKSASERVDILTEVLIRLKQKSLLQAVSQNAMIRLREYPSRDLETLVQDLLSCDASQAEPVAKRIAVILEEFHQSGDALYFRAFGRW